MGTVMAAATYVQIGREELEGWLDSIGYRGKWARDPRFKGVYLISLSPTVAVKLSSTIGSEDDAMAVGRASMQLALVSLVTGRVVNKKAQGQGHFKRTTGWKKTWAAGIETMKKAYLSSSDFYDVIAGIEDREKYKIDLLNMIEKIPGWKSDNELIAYHRKIEQGGVIMPRELDFIAEAANRPAKGPDPQKIEPNPKAPDPVGEVDEARELRMDALRKLWVLAKRANDEWVMTFAQDIAQKYVAQGRRLSGPQLKIVGDKLHQYRVVDLNGNRAYELF
jgi:hypothetical protein